MTTVVSVAQGGTGANSASSARSNLGAAPSAAYDQANNAYAAANTASSTGGGGYDQANAAYGQANSAYNQANNARSDANTTFATINTTFSTVNTSLGTINTNYQAAYSQANTARDTANNAYNNSNTKLSTSGGSISGDLAITGNLTVQGNATTINVTNLSVNDSMILLSTGGVGDSNDIGFIGHIQRGATDTHVGLIRKATQNQFYLFDNYEVEPTNNVIDVAGNNFRVGNLRLGIVNADSYVTAAGMDITGQANAAYGQANAAYGQANAAYSAANNRVLKAGDTMTGQLNISSGGLLVTGNSNFDSGTLFVNSVNDRIGISTTSPAGKLNIIGGNGDQLFLDNTGQQFTQAYWRNNANNYGAIWSDSTNNLFEVYGYSGVGLTFSSNATERMRITSAGNVGIGTTNPAIRTHIYGTGWQSNIVGSNLLLLEASGTTGAALTFKNASGSYWSLYNGGSSSWISANNFGFVYHDGTNDPGGPKITFTSSGNVGIGTTGPDGALHIKSATNKTIKLDSTLADGTGSFSIMAFARNGTDKFRIFQYGDDRGLFLYNDAGGAFHTTFANTGHVGIGTSNPTTRLDVSGIISVRGSDTSTDSLRLYNTDGNYTYLRTTSATNTNNFWLDPTLGSLLWLAWDNPGQARTAATYTQHYFGTGRGTTNESVHVLRGDIEAFSSAGGVNWRIAAGTGALGSHTFFNSGNVGVGTNNPAQKFEVIGIAQIVNNQNNVCHTLRLHNDNVGQEAGMRIRSVSSAGNYCHADIAVKGTGASDVGYLGFKVPYNDTAGAGYKMVINSDGNVGIGTTSPSTTLHVDASSGGIVRVSRLGTGAGIMQMEADGTDGTVTTTNTMKFVTNGSERMRLDTSGNLLLNAFSGRGGGSTGYLFKLNPGKVYFELMANNTTSQSDILFTDGTSGNYGIVGYDHSNDSLRIYTAASWRMTVDSSGSVGIGTTSPGGKLDVYPGASSLGSAGANGIRVHRPNAYGNYGYLEYLFGSQDTVLGSSYGGGAHGRIFFRTHDSAAGTSRDAMIINDAGKLGVGTSSFNTNGGVLQVADGISFPATQSACSDANTLDDYEEGTWTPTFGKGSSNPTVSYSDQNGTYVKIGRMVYCFFDMTASSISGGSGDALIRGLPFTVRSGMAGYSVGQYRDAGAVAAGGSSTNLKGFAQRADTYIYLQLDYTGASGFGYSAGASWGSSGRITGYVIYEV